MKLLYCKTCGTVFSLLEYLKYCPGCEECCGRYIDKVNAVWLGDAIPIGFANSSFQKALANQPEKHTGPKCGERFEAFVIEKDCPTFRKE